MRVFPEGLRRMSLAGRVTCATAWSVFVLIPSVFGQEAAPPRALDVTHYDATIEPDLAAKTVKGRVAIDFVLAPESAQTIELDIGALTVDFVNEGGAAREFTQGDRRLRVILKASPSATTERRIVVEYHGAPRFGLQFAPEKSQIYTIFSTSQWMPCIDAPSDRATLRLNLVLPKELVVVANGRLVSSRPASNGRVMHEWRLDRAVPTFTFGFAAGKFVEATDKRGKTKLRYLASAAPVDDLRRIFFDTADMIAYFEGRSGVRYPEPAYAQALVQDTAGQEMSGFSLLSEAYGQEVLADPQRVGLIAHELAHQWWGIGVTCEDWTHFWLNEGFATFMAAAYREARFGRDVYLKDVEGWRVRYERVRTAGKDRSLAFPDWNHPTSDDRALVYQKGALVLHQLREELGEGPFWKAIRVYTKGNFGKSVTTRDFQRSLEESTGRDLSEFFNQWVYLKAETVR